MVRPDAAPGPGTPGSRIRLARLARGWSQDVLARRVAEVRRARGETVDPASVKTQLSRWENDRVTPDRFTREIVAEAFSTSSEALFGVPDPPDLPRSVLLQAHVTPQAIDLLRARRAVHAQTEASFGPAEAGALVAHDLATIDGLLRIAPEHLSAELHEVAALVAELGGWIAQDSGDAERAEVSTSRAYGYAQAARKPELEAMVLMRWANIVTPGDPQGGAILAERADEAARAVAPGRLHAAIARQRANAAALLGDRKTFETEAARAADHARAESTLVDLTPYADSAYVASETAAGLIVLDEPERAVSALADYVASWAPGQERDHAVALARWLHALAASGDLGTALDQCEHVLVAFQRAPSVRSRAALRAIMSLREQRGQVAGTTLRQRIATALGGVRPA